MRRRVWTVVALLAFGYALLPGGPALAGYGAIAWDRESGKIGWIWKQPTAKTAAEKAISECGASGCRLVIKPTTACAAVATTADGKAIGAAARKTQDEARLAALSDCQKRKAGDCVVKASDCNK
jgi:serine/threonine-protein kinase